MELSGDAKYEMKRKGIFMFQLDLGGFSEVEDVIYVSELKNNLFLVLFLEDRDFSMNFQRGKVFVHSEGVILDTKVSIGVREGMLYRLKGQPIRGSKGILDHGSISMT
jgi:hypothetical protein